MPSKKTCVYCGKEFEPKRLRNSSDGKPRYSQSKYCSVECYHACREEKKKKNKLKNHCRYCGKELQRWQKYYCSDECETEYKKIRDRKCINCGKLFDAKRIGKDNFGMDIYSKTKFCSEACRRDYKAKQKWGNDYIDADHAKRRCEFCGKEFIIERSSNGIDWSDKHYCSNDCRIKGFAKKKQKSRSKSQM